jgi:hypothetical protein
MLVEMVRIVFNNDNSYRVSTILVNPNHIVYLAEDTRANALISENKEGSGFHSGTMFTKMKLSDAGLISEITVIGSPSSLGSKIYNHKKRLLRG